MGVLLWFIPVIAVLLIIAFIRAFRRRGYQRGWGRPDSHYEDGSQWSGHHHSPHGEQSLSGGHHGGGFDGGGHGGGGHGGGGHH